MPKIKKLKQGKFYELKHTDLFCHCVGDSGFVDFSENRNDEDRVLATYIGQIQTPNGERNIFYQPVVRDRTYLMFSTENLDYVVSKVKKIHNL